MGTQRVRRATSGAAVALALALGAAVNAAAGQPATEEACQQRVNALARDHGVRLADATRVRAVRACLAGRMDRAQAIVKAGAQPNRPRIPAEQPEAQCLRQLDTYIAKNQLQPTPDALSCARRRCAAGDVRGAIQIIGAPQAPAPTGDQRAEVACASRLDGYIARNQLRVHPKTRSSAILLCAGGAADRAIALLHGQPAQPTHETPATPTDRCLRTLEAYIQKTGVRPEERNYESAKRHCVESGDTRRAVEVLRSGTDRPVPPARPLSESECLQSLATYVRRTGITPDKDTYASASARCASGDIRGAIAALRDGGRRQ